MAKGKKKQNLSPEQLLEQALVPEDEQPYEVPKNWVWTRMEYVATWGSGGTPSRKIPDYYQGTIPWIKTGELNNDFIYDSEERITEEAVSNSSAKIFPRNTVVIAMYGATIGKAGILGIPAATNQACACGIPSLAINYRYLFHYAVSEKENFINKGKGGAQPNISQEIIKKHTIPLPPLAEQQRIVDRIENLFNKLDQAKELIQNALDSFETRKAAILHKAFTGELTAKWREEHGVGMESWEDVTIKDVCTVNPKRADISSFADDTLVTFIPMSSVSDITGSITDPILKPLAEVRKGYTNFCENDVLFAKITPCMENGKSAIVGRLENGVGFGSTEFHVIRCSKRISNQFIHFLVRSSKFRDEAKSVMTGAVGQQRVPKVFLENYPISLPSIDEQVEIVKLLNQIFEADSKAKELMNILDHQIDLIKKSILSRAFRGELGTNDETDDPALELLKSVLLNQ
jgi:type I restriction enzyme S subunit